MMKKLIFLLLIILSAIPIKARDFTYTYEGQTITYTVIEGMVHICTTKAGSGSSYDAIPGNSVNGDLILPTYPEDKYVGLPYTLTECLCPNLVDFLAYRSKWRLKSLE